jgi:hypothetical protein
MSFLQELNDDVHVLMMSPLFEDDLTVLYVMVYYQRKSSSEDIYFDRRGRSPSRSGSKSRSGSRSPEK